MEDDNIIHIKYSSTRLAVILTFAVSFFIAGMGMVLFINSLTREDRIGEIVLLSLSAICFLFFIREKKVHYMTLKGNILHKHSLFSKKVHCNLKKIKHMAQKGERIYLIGKDGKMLTYNMIVIDKKSLRELKEILKKHIKH